MSILLNSSHELNLSLCRSLVFHYRQLSTELTAEQSRTELSKQLDFTMPCCYCYFRYHSCNCSRGARLNPLLGSSNYLPEYFAQNLHGYYLLSSDAEELSPPTSLYKVLNYSSASLHSFAIFFPPHSQFLRRCSYA